MGDFSLPWVLHFREVEKRPKPFTLSPAEGCVVMEEVEAKIHKATCCRLAINENMSLRQMPTSRADKKLGCLVIEPVNPVPGLVMEAYSPVHSILQVNLPSHQILPTWWERIFKISLQNRLILCKLRRDGSNTWPPTQKKLWCKNTNSPKNLNLLYLGSPFIPYSLTWRTSTTYHENFSTGVESIDDHLPFHGTGNLHLPISDSRWHRRTHPVTFPHIPCSRIETRQRPLIVPPLRLPPTLHCILNLTPKLPLQISHKLQGILSQNLCKFFIISAPDINPIGSFIAHDSLFGHRGSITICSNA